MRPFRSAPTPSIRVLSAAIIFMLLLACSSNRKAEVTPITPTVEAPRIVEGTPPTTSELALLMREMTAFTDSTGKRITSEKDLLPFPEQFKKLRTAEPTPGMVERRTFDPFAQAWLHQLDLLYITPTADRAEVFNGLVRTCAGCHGQMCPGPLVKIKKLSIPEGAE